MTKDKALTPKEVAEILDVSLSTVRRLITDGILTAAKVYRQYRITMQDLNNYLKKHGSTGFTEEEK